MYIHRFCLSIGPPHSHSTVITCSLFVSHNPMTGKKRQTHTSSTRRLWCTAEQVRPLTRFSLVRYDNDNNRGVAETPQPKPPCAGRQCIRSYLYCTYKYMYTYIYFMYVSISDTMTEGETKKKKNLKVSQCPSLVFYLQSVLE